MSWFKSTFVVLLALTVHVSSAAHFAQPVAAIQQSEDGQDTDWPALRFDIAYKRGSKNSYGQSTFSMFANPVVSDDGAEVLYDVLANFTKDDTTFNYTLVDGIAFIASKSLNKDANEPSIMCLDSPANDLPPINVIVSALNEAVGVPSASASGRGETRCSNGSSYEISVDDVDFEVCASSSSGFTMTGTVIDMAVVYLENRVEIVKPSLSSSAATTCKLVASASSVTPIGRLLLSGDPSSFNEKRKLKAEFDFDFWDDDASSADDSSDNSCSCKSTKRPCLFIHGMGVDEEEPENVDSFSYYWGNMTDHAPCCSSMKFTVLNTVNNSWTNDTLQQKVCDRAVAVSKRSSEIVVADTILITHSMGNLMLAGAIATGKCSLDLSSTWVGMAGPMQGSMASDFVQDTCVGDTNFLLEEVANITGRCPPTVALKSLPSQGGNFSTAELNAQYTAAQNAYSTNVSALMCSAGYSGLPSKYQAEFWALGTVVPYKSHKNDGMVAFESCAAGIPESKFGESWKSPFYKTKLNHYDSEFLYGDSPTDEKKMPIKWFECLL